MDGLPLVQVRAVGKTYVPSPPLMRLLLRSAIREPVIALQDVSLEVQPGKICAIVGPNGAGKSTLFRILTGLTTPTTGSASICGFDVTRQSFQVRRLIGFHAADERMILGRHSCRENLAFHGRLQGIPEQVLRRRIGESLELVGLERAANRLALALSSGMKARLQLARALLHQPRVLILDEPTGSLDPVAAYQFLEIIKETVTSRGIAVLISSHRLEEIEALPDHVLLLNEGSVVYNGNLDALRRHWEEPRLEITFASLTATSLAVESLRAMPGVAVIGVDEERVTLKSGMAAGKLFASANGTLDDVVSIVEARMPLRDLLAKMLLPTEASSE